uniref:G-protein coupled receptors family 1 profile domain-containing protein n=1 Tax=Sus scrofa TaxID=9823 RepID=A0A8D1LF24_PIG
MKYEEMEAEKNVTTVMQFVLQGFSDLPNLQGLLFAVFSITYVIILIGNRLIIVITRLDATLQKPMYFFLANFSSLEICYVSVTLLRILVNICTQDRSISMLACASHMCFFLILGATECFFLAVMAYDYYVVISNPLHYSLVMNHKICIQLAVGSWISGIPMQIGQTCQIFSLHFCHSNQINHFFCDIPPILNLACGDTSVHNLPVYVVALLFVSGPFMLVLGSYSKIISTILRFPIARGQTKAFSTCSSHLLFVFLFFVSATITYLRPKSSHSAGIDKLLSLFYTTMTPMFNPMICSLRNKDVIAAFRKVLLNKYLMNLFINVLRYFFLKKKLCVYLGPHPQHMEVFRPGVELELQMLSYDAAMAMPDLSCICDLHHMSGQHLILKPLSNAKDQTCILMDTRHILNSLSHNKKSLRYF